MDLNWGFLYFTIYGQYPMTFEHLYQRMFLVLQVNVIILYIKKFKSILFITGIAQNLPI